MTAVRAVLIALGMVAVLYGAVLLWDNSFAVLVRIVVWAAVGLVVHDFVFAPLCAAAGFAWGRLLPAGLRSPVAVAALFSVVLAALAIPVYAKPGLLPDNLTVVDRDYPTGFWISLAVVWVCVPLYYLLMRLLPVRQQQVVEREGADDVESQPPPV